MLVKSIKNGTSVPFAQCLLWVTLVDVNRSLSPENSFFFLSAETRQLGQHAVPVLSARLQHQVRVQRLGPDADLLHALEQAPVAVPEQEVLPVQVVLLQQRRHEAAPQDLPPAQPEGSHRSVVGTQLGCIR